MRVPSFATTLYTQITTYILQMYDKSTTARSSRPSHMSVGRWARFIQRIVLIAKSESELLEISIDVVALRAPHTKCFLHNTSNAFTNTSVIWLFLQGLYSVRSLGGCASLFVLLSFPLLKCRLAFLAPSSGRCFLRLRRLRWPVSFCLPSFDKSTDHMV